MARIQKLDASLVNKIAAGEVIERPASVVKELVENALDAGATRIDITIEQGGTTLIRVTDNGYGMTAEDLRLAVEPHATSKIATADDLFSISTLGFRGEALASIASVSHLRLVSRTAEQIDGYQLTADDGRLEGPSPCAAPVGTTVEIRQLFWNVPARRKFLRQAATEFAHVNEQVARLAMAHPQVAFSIAHNDRPVKSMPAAADRRSRISDFYGVELGACLLPISRTERVPDGQSIGIEAWIAPPAQSRASSKWQYVFLNGRCIVDRRINFALREAFRGLVEHDRYPVAFIFLSVDPRAFDVNVHPTKIEVRWRDAGLVQSLVLAALRETLLGHDLTPALSLARAAGDSRMHAEGDEFATTSSPNAHELQARQALADYLKRIDPTQARISFQPPRFGPSSLRPSITRVIEPYQSQPSMGAETSTSDSPAPSPDRRADNSSHAADAIASDPAAVLQVHNTYIVAQTAEGIVIIDQHALHERILYERFRERILAGPLESQRLLMPVTLEVSAADAEAAIQWSPLLAKLGIEIEPFGPSALAIHSFPVLLAQLEITAFVGDLLDRLIATDGTQTEETTLHRLLDMMACKAAVKAGDPLTTEEMQALLLQRHLSDRSSNCPHGRPTTLQLSTRDLERQFKRS